MQSFSSNPNYMDTSLQYINVTEKLMNGRRYRERIAAIPGLA